MAAPNVSPGFGRYYDARIEELQMRLAVAERAIQNLTALLAILRVWGVGVSIAVVVLLAT